MLDSKPVHAFDFDGTLTHRDSFIAFLKYLTGTYSFYLVCLINLHLFLAYLVHRDRGILKSHLLYNIVGPIEKVRLAAKIKAFANSSGAFLFRADALARWRSIDRSQYLTGIVTASPQILVAVLAAPLNPDFVIGTELGFDKEGRLTRSLAGPNCRCEQKVIRLKALFGESLNLEAAYGDTKGDHEMLMAARHSYYRLFKSKS